MESTERESSNTSAEEIARRQPGRGDRIRRFITESVGEERRRIHFPPPTSEARRRRASFSTLLLLLTLCIPKAARGFVCPQETRRLHIRWNRHGTVARFSKSSSPQGDSNPLDNEADESPQNVPSPVELDLIHRMSQIETNLLQRISQLEQLVSSQQVQIQNLKQKQDKLVELTTALSHLVALLRDTGTVAEDSDTTQQRDILADSRLLKPATTTMLEDAAGIFSSAPTTVMEAADAAGAAILAGLLGGQQRLLVDVRDNELCTDAATLVEFIELAILPVAAGLEGLRSQRNRLKIVLPTISHLMMYRKHMALAAPDVVALSTLGLDPVEKKDNLVVVVVPSPEDTEGLDAMNALLAQPSLNQPLVVLNHHMVPTKGMAAQFEVAYHLRLLSVQYMSGDAPPEIPQNATKDVLLEAAMKHAQQPGVNRGTTRAMVIRAFPRPWHVFVDTSPDTDADFSIAATFDDPPKSHEIHKAIVECLEGSEEEDEIVAQQMQIALELGQLDKISDMLWSMGLDDDEDGDDPDDEFYDMFGEDSV